MKKKFILFPLVVALIAILLSNANGPGIVSSVNATGSSGSPGCSCHSGTASSSNSVTVQLLNGSTPVTAYIPGVSYTIRVSATNTGATTLPKFGFQLTARTGSANAGTLTAPTGTHTVSVSGTTMVEHGPGALLPFSGTGGSGTTYRVDVPWTAPSSGTGTVTLYSIVNLVNNNSSNDAGDLWNNTSVTLGEMGPITGPTTVCTSNTITLANILGGGTWQASGSNVTIGASTGIVTGVTSGTSIITYTAGANTVTTTVTVNQTPTISGSLNVCQTLSTSLSATPTGGTWLSGTTSVATVNSSGVVSGVGSGTSVITYTSALGCIKTAVVTVAPYSPITGGNSVCMGSTLSLSNATGGGTWSSSNTAAGTISSSGVLTPIGAGTTTISYAATGACTATQVVTVNALPTPFALSGGGFYCAGTAGANICLCAGTDIGTSYQLYMGSTPVGGTLSGTGSPASFGTFSTVGSYSAVGTTTAGCTAPMVGTVTVSANPAPAIITGPGVVCLGSNITLANATSGGTWSSSAVGTAFIGSTSGIVTGLTAGTATISYILTSTGCYTTTVVTVSPVPTSIGGSLGICAGTTSSLSSTPSGGTWSSGSTAVGTIDATTGVFSGLTAGTSNISYTLSSGCRATAVATVNQTPVISGVLGICVGFNTSLSATPLGGTWTSGTPSVATIGTDGVVTAGSSGGTTTISYVSPAGCLGTAVVTVNTLPVALTGTLLICAGSTTTLSSTTSGGSWSSAAPGIATVNSSGVVTGVSGGTAAISYSTATGCSVSSVVTVNSAPAAITGIATLCPGTTTTLATTTTGGTWSTSSTAIATVDATTGVVTGVANGITDVIFTITSTGCTGIRTVTVNANPAAITGTAVVCEAATTTLANTTSGGTWTSSATGIATVNFSTGVVTGVAAGTTTITYILGTGCLTTTVATVNAIPAPIAGANAICQGGTTTLTDATGGGSWSSSLPAASVGASNGIVSGTSAGTTVITYMLGTSCYRTFGLTVNALPASITGTASVCQGSTTTLSSATAGGSWSSDAAGTATVGSANGLVTGVTAGTANITYTLSSTGCAISTTVTVNALPGSILGSAVVCPSATTTLLNGTGGGSWSSANTGIATVNASSGVVTGVATGTTSITYTLAGTGCQASVILTVSAAPSAGAISGTTSICTGTTATFTNSVSTGSWSASNSNATVNSAGIVTGVTAGAVTISYSVTNSCGTAVTTFATNITNSAAVGAFGGVTDLCPGGNGTVTNGVTGGVWTSSTTSVATVGSLTGLVSAIAAGTTTLTYTVSTPCGVASGTTVFTVNPLPSASIGVMSACVGTSTTLSNTAGGTWISGNAGIATVGSSSGIVTGTGAGTANITFMLPTGCTTSSVVSINPLPLAITGSTAICEGAAATMADATVGGTWSSTVPSVATISSTGVVAGLAAGTTTFSYTLSTGCARTMVFSVNPLPSTLSGTTSVCVGNSTSLGNTISGGSWISSATSVATIGVGTGVVNGITAGTSTITYTLPTGCRRTGTVSVNPLPAGITGGNLACVGATNTLSNTTAGGTWLSGNTALATIGSADGVVMGMAVGTVPMTYMLTATGCISTTIVSVNPAPSPITGTASICAGSTSALADADAGGTWSSSNTSVAPIVFTSGVMIGSSAGTAIITYTLPTGCKTTLNVSINAIPPAIGGTASVCHGLTTTLTNAVAGGTWMSASTAIANIGSGDGIMMGVAAGTTTVTFTSPEGCMISRVVSVNAAPLPITGTLVVCEGAMTTLSSATAGGTWASGTTGTATAGLVTGVMTGVAAGTSTITYTGFNGCKTYAELSVNPLPVVIGGTAVVCAGAATTLTNATLGGVWSGTVTGTAAIDATTGIVTSTSAGTAVMTYTLPTGCYRTAVVSVNPLPVAGTITGATTVCQSATITMVPGITGGTWVAVNTNATISSAGVVTGVNAGVDTMVYTVTTSCGTASTTRSVTVNPLPVAGTISGPANVCVGVAETFTATVTGGMWSSGAPAHVMVGATSGIASGGSAGNDTVFYSVTNSCGIARTYQLVTVLPHASAGTISNSGSDSMCIGNSVHLTASVAGGSWSASNGNITVSAGHVTGVAAGPVFVIYIVSNACSKDTIVRPLTVLSKADCASWLAVKNTGEAAAYELKVYPNPSEGAFTVDVPEADQVMVTITDIAGRTIASRLVEGGNAGHVTFNLNNIASGSYMVKVDANGNSYRTKVLIVQ